MNISPRAAACALLTVLGLGIGIVANPWIRTGEQLFRVLAVLEVTATVCWLGCEFRRATAKRRAELLQPRATTDPANLETIPTATGLSPWTLCQFFLIVALWVFLYRDRWLAPQPMPDDDQLFRQSVDWATTRRHLLVPMVDHVMILPRLITFVALQLSGDMSRDAAGAAVSAALFLPALGMLFLVARNEWRSDGAALLAVAIFALSPAYREVIFWYTATTQWLVPLNMLLAGILLVQRGGFTMSVGRMVAVTIIAATVPLCFSFGMIVGPLLSVWLATRSRAGTGVRSMGCILAPTVGAVAGTAVLMANLAGQGRSFAPEFVLGVVTSARLAMDVLLLRNLGIGWRLPKHAFCVAWPLIAVLLAVLVRRAPEPRRLIPILATVVLGYAAVVPFRAWVQYHDLVDWTRYQLFPHLGFALLMTDAFVGTSRRLATPPDAWWRTAQAALVAGVSLTLTWLHSGLSMSGH